LCRLWTNGVSEKDNQTTAPTNSPTAYMETVNTASNTSARTTNAQTPSAYDARVSERVATPCDPAEFAEQDLEMSVSISRSVASWRMSSIHSRSRPVVAFVSSVSGDSESGGPVGDPPSVFSADERRWRRRRSRRSLGSLDSASVSTSHLSESASIQSRAEARCRGLVFP